MNLSFFTKIFDRSVQLSSRYGKMFSYVIPLFHTGPESHELTRIDKYLDSWLNRTQFVKVLTDSHSP